MAHPRRHPAIARALTLSLATAMALSAPPAATLAQARKASCQPPSAHPKHGRSACGQSGRKGKADGGSRNGEGPGRETGSGKLGPGPGKTGSRPRKANGGGTKGPHSKRAHARRKPQGRTNKAKQKVASRAAVCEDGSAPILAPAGSFSCGDGSEPGCANGSEPILSSDHSTLVCEIGSGEEASPAEAASPNEEIPSEEGPPDEGSEGQAGGPGEEGAGWMAWLTAQSG